jgi:hypothetical protein
MTLVRKFTFQIQTSLVQLMRAPTRLAQFTLNLAVIRTASVNLNDQLTVSKVTNFDFRIDHRAHPARDH